MINLSNTKATLRVRIATAADTGGEAAAERPERAARRVPASGAVAHRGAPSLHGGGATGREPGYCNLCSAHTLICSIYKYS